MFGFGTELTLTFNYDQPLAQQKSVSLSRLNNEFLLNSGGEGYLSEFGIDRIERDDTTPDPEDHVLGSMLVKGVAYGIKYRYKIALQQLTKTKYSDIQAIITAQHKTGKLIRLDDRILEFTEFGARTRAIAPNANAPIISGGFVSYYASFLVWVPKIDRRLYEGDGRGQLEFEAIEYDKPLTP